MSQSKADRVWSCLVEGFQGREVQRAHVWCRALPPAGMELRISAPCCIHGCGNKVVMACHMTVSALQPQGEASLKTESRFSNVSLCAEHSYRCMFN